MPCNEIRAGPRPPTIARLRELDVVGDALGARVHVEHRRVAGGHSPIALLMMVEVGLVLGVMTPNTP